MRALLLLAALPLTGSSISSAVVAPHDELRELFDISAAPPLELRVDESTAQDLSGVRRVTVRYRSPAGGDVTADLFEPDGEGPFAGLLVMDVGTPSIRCDELGVAPSWQYNGARLPSNQGTQP